jgi:DNA-binding NtrC family response regulator
MKRMATATKILRITGTVQIELPHHTKSKLGIAPFFPASNWHGWQRSVVLTDGNTLRAPLEGLRHQTIEINSPEPITLEPEPVTLKDVERHHIRKALERANWVIGGATGAAVRLGMKRSTVYSRMQKLGIFRVQRPGNAFGD